MKSEDYNQEDLKKALVKLMEYWVMDNSEVEKKLNMDEKSVRRLLDPDTKSDLKTINHFLSIFGGSANVACSIPMKLLKRIHYQLIDLKDLIGAWAEEQKTPVTKELAKAKFWHFESVVNLFHHHSSIRDLFYIEDEIYYRACDAKKYLKILKKDNLHEGKCDEYITKLDQLENEIIESYPKERNISVDDVIEKLEGLRFVLARKEMLGKWERDVRFFIGEWKKFGKYKIEKKNNGIVEAESLGQDTNYSVALDEYFDSAKRFEPNIDTSEKDYFAYNKKLQKKKGSELIYFIFKACGCRYTAFIKSEIWKDTKSQEYKDAVEKEFNKMAECIKKYNLEPMIKELLEWEKKYNHEDLFKKIVRRSLNAKAKEFVEFICDRPEYA